MKQAVYRRLIDTLSQPPGDRRFDHIAAGDRRAILEILPRDQGRLSGALLLSEGLRPSDSPTRSPARRFVGALRSRGSLAHSLAACVGGVVKMGFNRAASINRGFSEPQRPF